MNNIAIPALCALCLAANGAACAQATGTDAENFPTLTCSDFLRGASAAVAPKNASRQQRRQAETAQDAIAAAMVWMHGYLAGRNTPNLGKISREWIEQTVTRIARECQAVPDPAKVPLVDLVVRT